MTYHDDQPTDAQIESEAEERWNRDRACQTPGCGHEASRHSATVEQVGGICFDCPCTRYTDADERFWSKVDKTGECWEWTAAKLEAGYGVFRHADGRTVKAHRHAYELVIGPIPDGLVIDHLCKNKSCVNPDHLELVTVRVNTERGTSPIALLAQATHCKHGHEWTPENTRITPRGHRDCRACARERWHQRKDKP